ncbi:MAG TPA: twin-arginine translocation signal domain-containing protein, partial [Candidatus Limnocylindrales bacterium]|nr:twin-arginine translocation signal domain-containing protein [Candidatus Limnocylindrales bacterium]
RAIAVQTAAGAVGTRSSSRLLRTLRREIRGLGLEALEEAAALRDAERLMTGPVLSRRDLLRASAAGGTALALGGLILPAATATEVAAVGAEATGSAGELPANAVAPTLTASVLRREDMLALRLDFYNLVRSGMNLVRRVAGDPTYIVATIGYGTDHAPQNIGEEAFLEAPPPDDETPKPPGDVRALAAGPTRLAFVVPTTVTSIPYQLSAILALLPAWKLRVVPAALPPGATPSTAPVLTDPTDTESRIEAPWDLVLSPHDGATWSHASKPVTRNGRTELWHTRLSEQDPVGRAIRAVWAGDYDPDVPPAKDDQTNTDPFRMSLTQNDRWQIVGLTSNFGITDFTPTPVQADRLMLSALGAWLDARGVWDPPVANNLSIEEWRHVATMGRDQFVKVVRRGILLPFGHRAVRVKITERKVNAVEEGSLTGSPAAYLRQREFIVVRQPVVTYPDDNTKEPNQGRPRPFRQVELKTLVTPDLDTANGEITDTDGYFPRSGNADVPFNIAATDREGRVSEFSLPLVFIEIDYPDNAAAFTAIDKVVTAYNGLKDAAGLARRTASLNGAKVGFAESAQPGDTSGEVRDLTFGAVSAVVADAPVEGAPVLVQRELPFYPSWTRAKARLDAVEQIRGTAVASGVEIEPHPDFVKHGFGGTKNPADVFAKLVTPVDLAFSDGAGDRSGGVLTPDMTIVNLSRKLGPQGGQDNGLPTKFKPSDFFKGAKLLGAIDLADVLEELDFNVDGVTFPTIKTRPVYRDGDTSKRPEAIESTFQLKPRLKEDKTRTFAPKNDGSMTLDVLYRTPVDPPGEPTWQIVGDLRRFTVTLIGKEESTRFVRLHFSRLTFTARNGGKPDITPYIDRVELDGPLKFVDSIKDYLKTPGTGPNIDVTPSQISAGFTLQIPNIPAGAVTIMNIAFSATLIIPFNGDPARARFAMSSREHPFLVTYLALGGGGFFAVELALDGVKLFELDLVAGVEAAIDLILVKAEVHYLFGCHLSIAADNKVEQISYIRIGGHCGVWGVWSVTLDMYLALSYDSDKNELWGQARFTIEIEYLFLSKSVDLLVERRIAGPANAPGIEDGATARLFAPGSNGDGGGGVALASFVQPSGTSTTTAATASPPLGFATLVSQNEWNAYAAAFATNA